MPGMVDDFLDWLETLDCPPLTRVQKAMLAVFLSVMLLAVITTFTGHAYLAAVVFLRAIDEMSLLLLTVISFAVVMTLEVVGINTTLLALAVGYIYGNRMNTVLIATVVASAVTWSAVCLGCLISYVIGMTCLKEWCLELQRRNRVFDALDTVLKRKGLVVNMMLRLVLPDIMINMIMSVSSCSFLNFVLGFSALIPWITVYCFYGASIDKLSKMNKAGSDSGELAELLVGIIVTFVFSVLVTIYTKRVLEEMIADASSEANGSRGSAHPGDRGFGGTEMTRGSSRTSPRALHTP